MPASKTKNTSGSPEAQLDTFIDKYTPEVAALARACLAKMRARLPGATQLVYDNYNALAIGFGPSEKTSHAIFSVAVYPRWVNLFLTGRHEAARPAPASQGQRQRGSKHNHPVCLAVGSARCPRAHRDGTQARHRAHQSGRSRPACHPINFRQTAPAPAEVTAIIRALQAFPPSRAAS